MPTAVLFLAFNRPEVTRTTLARIVEARPTRLYVALDGPRSHVTDDRQNCAEVRALIESIDSSIPLSTRFRRDNLGCRAAVADALNWFFEQETEGIVLEDDCLPHPDFFAYCEWALNTYRDDSHIWHISGMGAPGKSAPGPALTLTHFPFIWGWATWRNRWQHYHDQIKLNDADLQTQIARIIPSRHGRRYWFEKLQQVREGLINTWDYQWMLALWVQDGLALTPNQSFIRNIGFDGTGTHTTEGSSPGEFAPLTTNGWSAPPTATGTPQFEPAVDAVILERVFHIEANDWKDRWRSVLHHRFVRWWWLGLRRRLMQKSAPAVSSK